MRSAISSTLGRVSAWWEEMCPQIMWNRDNCGMERWDGLGEGPCRHFGFEGFSISFSIFFGRMPQKDVGVGSRTQRSD